MQIRNKVAVTRHIATGTHRISKMGLQKTYPGKSLKIIDTSGLPPAEGKARLRGRQATCFELH
jgi:hypothetical protein